MKKARGSRRRPAPTELQRGHELGRGADNIGRYTSPLCRSVSESVDDDVSSAMGTLLHFDTDKRTHNTQTRPRWARVRLQVRFSSKQHLDLLANGRRSTHAGTRRTRVTVCTERFALDRSFHGASARAFVLRSVMCSVHDLIALAHQVLAK